LAGKDNFEQAKVDAVVVDTLLDLNTKVVPIRLEKDEAKKKELAKKLPKHLQNLDTLGKLYCTDCS
jgi:hypothetical protein